MAITISDVFTMIVKCMSAEIGLWVGINLQNNFEQSPWCGTSSSLIQDHAWIRIHLERKLGKGSN